MKNMKVSIRWMLVGVGLVAIMLAFLGKELSARRHVYLYDAAFHARREREELKNLAVLDNARRKGAPNAYEPAILKLEQNSRYRVLYHSKLKNKYKRAASHPWEAVPPDPKDLAEDAVRQSLYMTKDVSAL